MAVLSIAEALKRAIQEEMRADPTVFVMGEDEDIPGGMGGAFTVTKGLADEFGFERVIKTTCFLADMADFAAFNEVYARYFVSKPARSCVAVRELPKGVLCEIEAIAVK